MRLDWIGLDNWGVRIEWHWIGLRNLVLVLLMYLF